MSNIAISYARFSSAGQAEGHSLARQIEGAEAYAAQHGLVLDHALSFKDLGVSAWDRSNIEKGALGLFIKATHEGKVPTGATLIVESFDRLSRATPREALGVFLTIINAGLNVVTLTEPPKKFNKASVDANMFQLFEALMDMHRAHGESERKSQLLAKSWESRRKAAVEDKRVMTSKAPLWIKAEGPPRNKTFTLIPERAKVVKRVIEMAKAGIGNHTIIKTLHAEGIPSWPRSAKEEAKRQADGRTHVWEPSYIQKMVTHKALYGAVEIKGGKVVEEYYPPIITYDEFVYLQSLRSQRATRKTTSRKGATVTNLFSGLLKCGYCGSNMIVNGYTSRKTGEQFKYVACHGARTGKTDCRMHAWELRKLERELLFELEECDFGRLLGQQPKHEAEAQLIVALEQQATDLRAKIDRVYIAIEEGATGMVPRVKQYETELATVERSLKAKRQELAALQTYERGSHIDEAGLIRVKMGKLKRQDQMLELRALREQLSSMIASVVERVVLYPQGRAMQGNPSMDIRFKSGLIREATPEYVDF
jgi:DNA invertase Pin-like site-specific DNA recombinase